ncbi:glycosyltransferase family 2 protein [Polyangium jinanense]|uniref:Glycosyltransferase family 2 protein n=1 Tax=Polyangium jinanense TaxID=2829994 RepID=A0A9X3X9Z5_9BACT|nr:glycosyltransferase family 2 protein [Polyangium jinanense]MDC3958729.1 glycosyltransferase family 2 protein [Polyangium jinanense]MDC3985290.1 glycosyltransferase family 2 protein [Polyangium jinanense]
MDDWGPESGRGGVILRTLAERPFCSIVIPCYNEEEHIERVVHAAAGQRYPADRLEIFVVDGRSLDRTRDIVRALADEDPRIILLDNPQRLQAAAMNMAIKRSRGDVIVRMDAHADYDPGYVAASVAALRRTGALNVGGAMRPRAKTTFQKALCAALGSPLGVGGSASRDPHREGYVESVWCGAFRREAFELAGLFDPDARTNEDAELNQRILERGGRIYQSRDIVGHYYPRSSFPTLFQQYFNYGAGRARTILRRGLPPSIRPLIPFATLVTFTVLAALAAFYPPARPVLGAAVSVYTLAIFAAAAWASRRGDGRLVFLVAAMFPVMHLAHGLGFAVGLARYAQEPLRDAEPERLTAR